MKHRLLPLSLFIITVVFAAIYLTAASTDKEKQSTSTPPTGEEYIHSLRVNQHTGAILPGDVQKAREQVALNEAMTSTRQNCDWVARGPNNLGGRTRAILYDNMDPSGNTVYAGSVMGGLFKSTDGGSNWVKILHEYSNLHVTCMAQSEGGIIYVGTGEGFNVIENIVLEDWGYDGGFMGQGVFVSNDGSTFAPLESTIPTGDDWLYINEIIINGNDRIFVSTNNGLRYSDDGGSTWNYAMTAEGEDLSGSSQEIVIGPDGMIVTEVNTLCYVSPDGNPSNFILHSTDSTYDLPNFNVGRIEFSIPSTMNEMIYACVITQQGALENIYRSDDRGETWVVVGPGGSSNFNVFGTGSNVSEGKGLFSAAFEVQPDNHDILFLGGVDMWTGTRVADEGYYHWVKMSASSGLPWIFPLYLPAGHHTYAFNAQWSNRFLIGTDKGIYMLSSPEGFSSRNRDYIAGQFMTVAPSSEKQVLAGGGQDLGTLEIDGTLNPTDRKRGKSIWTTQADIPDGGTGGYVAYSVIEPEAIIYSKFPKTASGNVATYIRRNEFGGGPDWSANMMDGQFVSDAFLVPFLLWENFEDELSGDTTEYVATKNIPAGTQIWVESNTGGRPFKYITPTALNDNDTIRVQDPISSKFFIGGNNRVLLTKDVLRFDRAPEWWVISDLSHSGLSGIVQSMGHSSDANHLFVGTQEGMLYRISNIRYAYDFERADVSSPFSIISTNRIPVYLPGTQDEISQVITSVSVDPADANNVVITLANYGNEHYVYMSQNALSDNPEFVSIMGDPSNGGLPQMPAYSSLIEMDPNTDIVFVGTEYGIYMTENPTAANPTWTVCSEELGRVPVFMIRQQLVRKTDDVIELVTPQDTTYLVYKGNNNYGVIYAATYGRGLVTLDEFQQPVGIGENPEITADQADFSLYPNPAQEKVTIAVETKARASVEVRLFNLAGQLVRTYDYGKKAEGQHELSIGLRDLQSGTYVVQVITGKKSSTSKLIVY